MVTKLGAAARQLNRAITLFLEGDHVCSLTLAGAAEEILGVLTQQSGEEHAVAFIAKYHGKGGIAEVLGGDAKEIVKQLNKARNWVKHANNADEDQMDIDEADSVTMLMRAIPMARGLGVQIEREMEFNAWLAAHQPD